MSKYTATVHEFDPNKVSKHEKADSLKCYALESVNVCIRTQDWFNPDGTPKYKRFAHIEPETLVDVTKPEFNWLTSRSKDGKWAHVKAEKLRGVHSFGFFLPIEDSAVIGDNLWDKLGLQRWQPVPNESPGSTRGPEFSLAAYDVENLRKYVSAFIPNEPVYITEKLEGESSKVCCQNGQVFVGSRLNWKLNCQADLFWRAYRNTPTLEKFVKENEKYVIFGEQYGKVKHFPYDVTQGQVKFRAFDIFDVTTQTWLNIEKFFELCDKYGIPTTPLLGVEKFDFARIETYADGPSTLNRNHIREGCVIVTKEERYDLNLGRCKAKLKGKVYLGE